MIAVEEVGKALPAILGKQAILRAWLAALASFVLCSFIRAYEAERNAGYTGADLAKRTVLTGIRVSFVQIAILLLIACLFLSP